jgi:hypothetical protein
MEAGKLILEFRALLFWSLRFSGKGPDKTKKMRISVFIAIPRLA